MAAKKTELQTSETALRGKVEGLEIELSTEQAKVMAFNTKEAEWENSKAELDQKLVDAENLESST